ncbi:MAG: hypothetical protein ACXWC8_19930 [Limisphaerales bacterium]
MTDDQGKTFKKDVIERFDKAKGRLQQSFPEIQQLIKTSNVVEAARKIIGPTNIERISDGLKKLADAKLPQSIFKQFASDLQLKDLLAKAEALVAKANLTFAKTVSRDTLPTETFPNETPPNELPSKKAGLKKTPSKGTRLKKTVSKKTLSKKKTKRPLKRRVKTLS